MIKHIEDCHLGINWKGCPACVEIGIDDGDLRTRKKCIGIARANPELLIERKFTKRNK